MLRAGCDQSCFGDGMSYAASYFRQFHECHDECQESLCRICWKCRDAPAWKMAVLTMELAQLSDLELAAYLCSRVCHDVISPVGAVVNGLELLEDESDEQMRGFALELVRKSAVQASAKLQFARLAFGAAGSAGSEIDLSDAEAVTRSFMDGGKVELNWIMRSCRMEKNKVKLLLNLVLAALQGIIRGGTLSVTVDGDKENPRFVLKACGKNARIPDHFHEFMSGNVEGRAIDVHVIQPYYAARIAQQCGFSVSFDLIEDTLTITAASVSAPLSGLLSS